MTSLAAQLAKLPPEQLNDISDEQAAAWLYDWELWAREKQKEPVGNWAIWLILAGRGFGKSRTGAEFTRKRLESGKYGRWALVGRTTADVRDVMVEGESGILATSPPWFKPKYEPSKRRLTWPNGAIATTYSADEPDLLRGPQHDGFWCLAGDTPVLMGNGSEKPIVDICVGDYVMTRRGPRRVTGHCLTKQNTEVYLLKTLDGRAIIGTAEHPVWVQGRGFIPMSMLSKGMSLCVTRASNGTAISGINDLAETTTNGVSCSIEQYGNKPMGQFQRGITSITKTATKLITVLRTWNYSLMESIVRGTMKKSWFHIGRKLGPTLTKRGRLIERSDWRKTLCVLFAGKPTIAPPHIQRVSARLSALKPTDQALSMAKYVYANIALLSIERQSALNVIAPANAMPVQLNNVSLPCKAEIWNVLSVVSHFNQNDQTPDSAPANVPLLSTTTIVSVEKLAKRTNVYDISIEDAHEFFAQGILVHNCDELAAWKYDQESWDNLLFGTRLGRKPQGIVTTTPRPTKIIKRLAKDKTVHVTTGTTFENKANLAPSFFTQIVGRYKDTRLGLQELYAQILADAQGALWKREEMIEQYRVTEYPDLLRIVVGVDPAVADPSSSRSEEAADENAETGIVVAGIDGKGHGYVLDDKSLQASPLTWASEAITAYKKYRADLVLGEKNNGGALVESNIRTVDRHVSYKPVWASRGKYTRAEPIASFYEQGRVHHVGMFPLLEDQMCQWEPLTGQKSPDRLDALVWALTELMGEKSAAEQVEDMKRRVTLSRARTLVPALGGLSR